ncbi:Tubulin--tyrosine ligase-like protein 12 [Liparis tanakae]|uniref:Tubulin--tyrosine ligase-like protein 12 n=1 Tax=Liparis tanakae TaxID=230148 RepID=A0A4Z2EA55_9TELE|nr:Tubulin--tyrosine ligase-like protein 12 [Liparis tanakae]
MSQVRSHLTHPRFQLTEDEEEADIMWLSRHIKDYRKLSEERPHVMLNQFPCESLVTTKDCMAAVARRVGGGSAPDWLPETFNLQSELPQFVKRHQERQRRSGPHGATPRKTRAANQLGEDNHWICKPWNLARGLDTHVTNNMDYIIRQRESTPKTSAPPLNNGSLYHGSRGPEPRPPGPERTFSLDHLDDYQKHFTVMNYSEAAELKQDSSMDHICVPPSQAEVFQAFGEFFRAAASRPAPYGVCPYPASRAIYAVDLMLKWSTAPNGERWFCQNLTRVQELLP